MLRTLLVIGRNFRPITPFISVYLVEEKAFSTKEIVEKIIPWWLYAMLLFSLIVPVLVNKIGLLYSILGSVFAELIGSISLIKMKRRSIGVTVFVEILNAFRSSMAIVDKRYYGEESRDRSIGYSMIRRVTGIFSSFLSQNMYYISGGSLASFYLTVISQLVVFIITLSLHSNKRDEVALPIALDRMSIGLLGKIFSYTGAFTLSSCFKIYVDIVLIERTGTGDEREGIVQKVLDYVSYVFYLVAFMIIKGFSYITDRISVKSPDNQQKPLHGYMEGLTRIVGVALAIPLVKLVSLSYMYTEILSVGSWAMQIIGIGGLRRSKSLFGCYIAYLLSFLGSTITTSISYNKINSIAKDKIITIMSYIGGISCATHAIIDMYARKKKLSPEARFWVYARIGSGLFFCASICSIVEYLSVWNGRKIV
ncbi:hypothetical protein NEFER03_0574 [Nematocida sp. LUAm3]|nr:hypothetical protein NEFER03_0574 [Nematocida sp. LUAm3]KAI5175541.1 hypothetical protein NEFER02_1447 [Nematocida sp. LUAm2]KAI5178429.1 hypothetical protein NEFER01_1576 [Nematocida sp. LUAm1]